MASRAYHKAYRDANPEKYAGYRYKYARDIHERFMQTKRRARPQGHSFSLTEEEYVKVLSSGICHYCYGPLAETGGALDRRDNQLGYTLSNVVPCCRKCNFRKGALESAGFRFPRTEELLRELLAGGS